MSNYNSYHTIVKTSYALGLENQVLPQKLTQKIPRSTSQGWKQIHPEQFVGSEVANQVEIELEQIKLMLDKRIQKMRRAFYAFARLYLTIIEFADRKNFEKIISQNREVIIDLIDNLPLEFNQAIVCKFLNISVHQFKIWKNNRQFRCHSSLIGYCTKRFPTQISQKEINILKSFMARKRLSTWSIASIWGYAFKKQFISMSRTSWYRYCLKLNIHKRNPVKKPRKRISVNASRPNEIWHMDVTEFISADYVKFHIHTIIDNFSRKIVAYTIARDKSAKTRLLSLKQAIEEQFYLQLSSQELDLIVDGGAENNNTRINNFMRHCQVKINKKIALKQVRFSNSVIEANFKMLKAFLRKRGEILAYNMHKEIAFFVKDHNSHKPYYRYQIHTPDEIHDNPKLIDVKPILQKANQQRLQNNRSSCCKLKP